MTNPVDIFFKNVIEYILENSTFHITTFGEGLSEDSLDYKVGLMLSINTSNGFVLFNNSKKTLAFRIFKSDLDGYYKYSKLSNIVNKPMHFDYFDLFSNINEELKAPNIKIYEAYCDKDYVNERLNAYIMNKALE